MNALTEAVVDRLASDTVLAEQLGTYQGRPSVFSAPPIRPADADVADLERAFPMIVFEGVTSDAPFTTKTSDGRQIEFDVGCYALLSGSIKTVDEIAEQVRNLLDAHLSVDGFGSILTMVVGGPVPQDGDQTHGRIISVRVIMEA